MPKIAVNPTPTKGGMNNCKNCGNIENGDIIRINEDGTCAECGRSFTPIMNRYKEIYITWNIKEDRPAIYRENFGGIVVHLNKENAEAYRLEQLYPEDYKIVKAVLEV